MFSLASRNDTAPFSFSVLSGLLCITIIPKGSLATNRWICDAAPLSDKPEILGKGREGFAGTKNGTSKFVFLGRGIEKATGISKFDLHKMTRRESFTAGLTMSSCCNVWLSFG